MDRQILNFTANEQILVCDNPIKISTNKVNYIEARFDLGQNWSGYDSVRAVWFNDFQCISTVLDSQGVTFVPFEVMKRRGNVKVNLVGSISEDDVLTDRLTSYPVVAVIVDCIAQITGANTSPITPSEYEQFVASVRNDADRAEAGATSAETYASNAESSADNALLYSQNSEASAIRASGYALDAQGYAQNASDSAQNAETAKDEAEDARDEIRNMSANATTLPSGSDATASYSDGVLSLGIPQGIQGEKGDNGDTGATPNLSIGTVETLEPTQDAYVTRRGTDDNPIFDFGIPKGDKGDTGEVTMSQLSALLPTDTASGSIASFPDGQSIIPALSVKAQIEPIQDLHGYDKPWSGGNGKNKLPSIGATFTDSGVTWTLNDDGSVKLSGTASANSVYDFGRNVVELEAGTYFANETASGYSVTVFSIVGGTASVVKSGGGQFTLTEKTSVFMRVLVASGTTPNTTIYPQIEKSSSFTSYEPYSNICPISGHTECVTEVCGKNLAEEFLPYALGAYNGGFVLLSNTAGSSFLFKCIEGQSYHFSSSGTTNRLIWAFYDEHPTAGTATTGSWTDKAYNGFATVTAPLTGWGLLYAKNSADESLVGNLQIELGSTATAYEPYQGDTYTTPLGRTVYGGTLDVVSGELTVDRAYMVLNGTESNSMRGTWGHTYDVGDLKYGNATKLYAMSNQYEKGVDYWSVAGTGQILTNTNQIIIMDDRYNTVADWNAYVKSLYDSGNPIQIVYDLEAPQTIQLTPTEVELLLGTNNLWTDCGAVEVTYKADIQRWVLKKLSE